MDRLRSADEANAGQSIAPFLECIPGSFNDRRMVCQAKIIVRAEIQDGSSIGYGHLRLLRPGDDALLLEEARASNLGNLVRKMSLDLSIHGISSRERLFSSRSIQG